VVQDLSLETLQCGAGLDPEFADEPRAGLMEGLQRICLPAGAIQREHQLSAHSLAERVIDNEALELGDDLRVPAARELGSGLLLDRRKSELFEPHGLGGRELVVAKVRQRLAAEERERLAELPRTRGQNISSRRGDESLEAVSVQLIALRKPQSVSGRSRLDPLGTEPLAEGRDVTVQRLPRGLWRARTPQGLYQLVDRHDLARPKQQEREQRALLLPHWREVDAVGVHLEPAEEPEFHSYRV
jgi:hypothetical protein